MRLMLTALIAFSALTASAGSTILSLTHRNGQTSEFPIDETSKVTFSPNYIILRVNGENKLFPLSAIKGYRFINDPAAIGLAEVSEAVPFIIHGNSLEFPAVDHKRIVSIIDIEGRVINTTAIPAGETGAIATQHLIPGIYIVSVNGSNFKFAKK